MRLGDWMEASDQSDSWIGHIISNPVKGPVPLSAKCKKSFEQTRLNWMDVGYRPFQCTFWKYQGFIKVLSDLKCMKSHKIYSYFSKTMSYKPLPWYLMYLVFSFIGLMFSAIGVALSNLLIGLNRCGKFHVCCKTPLPPPGMEETLRKLGESVSFRKARLACVFAPGMFDRKWRENGSSIVVAQYIILIPQKKYKEKLNGI